jgi:hypothetical protein
MTLLDGIAPRAGLIGRTEGVVPASVPRVFRALAEVTASDLRATRVRLVEFVIRAGMLNVDEALYSQLLRRGFTVVASDPLREVVVGRAFGDTDWRRAAPPKLACGILALPRADSTTLSLEARLVAPAPLRGALRPSRPAVVSLLRAWLAAVQANATAR